MSSSQFATLAQTLMDICVNLRLEGEKSLDVYDRYFKQALENCLGVQHWYEATDCNIHKHLITYRNPTETVITILKRLKEI